MPPVSEAQRKAMGAAKGGHSTLGIPKKVGADFIAADKGGKLPAKAKSASGSKPGNPSSSGKAGGGSPRGLSAMLAAQRKKRPAAQPPQPPGALPIGGGMMPGGLPGAMGGMPPDEGG